MSSQKSGSGPRLDFSQITVTARKNEEAWPPPAPASIAIPSSPPIAFDYDRRPYESLRPATPEEEIAQYKAAYGKGERYVTHPVKRALNDLGASVATGRALIARHNLGITEDIARAQLLGDAYKLKSYAQGFGVSVKDLTRELEAGREEMAATLRASLDDVRAFKAAAGKVPIHPALRDAQYGAFWNNFRRDPFALAANLAVAGTVKGAPAMLAAPLSAPAALTITALTSFGQEYADVVMETLNDEKVDLTNLEALEDAFKNDALMARAQGAARKKGVTAAAFDTMMAGLGRHLLLARKYQGTSKGEFANKALETGADTASAALSTGIGQMWADGKLDHDKISQKAVTAFAMGSVGAAKKAASPGKDNWAGEYFDKIDKTDLRTPASATGQARFYNPNVGRGAESPAGGAINPAAGHSGSVFRLASQPPERPASARFEALPLPRAVPGAVSRQTFEISPEMLRSLTPADLRSDLGAGNIATGRQIVDDAHGRKPLPDLNDWLGPSPMARRGAREPQLTFQRNGKPWQTEKGARFAMQSRKDLRQQNLGAVAVDGGFALRPVKDEAQEAIADETQRISENFRNQASRATGMKRVHIARDERDGVWFDPVLNMVKLGADVAQGRETLDAIAEAARSMPRGWGDAQIRVTVAEDGDRVDVPAYVAARDLAQRTAKARALWEALA